jgi:CarboxypepD_reg-like domain
MKLVINCLIAILLCCTANAQKPAYVSGIVVDENDKPLAGVTIEIVGKQKRYTTNEVGFFKISLTVGRNSRLEFSFSGMKTVGRNFNLSQGEEEKITIKLEKKVVELEDVVVKNQTERTEAGRVSIDASRALVNPSPISGIEQLIKIFVGSNNELTSNYAVRGGSYDENLIYVNDFEVFRPYLVRNGQQEGLSFINPEMTGGVKFYNGGFQTKYGDKMSSVLDITYRKPKTFGGSAYTGLLEQGLHIEGTAAKNKVTYLFGVRNRSNKNLLGSQDTRGNYIPSSSDLQTLITYAPNSKWTLEMLANFSKTKFTLFPEESKLTSSVFSPLYTANFGLDIFFEGQEKDQYSTNFIGLSATHQPRKNLKLKWMLSRFNNNEQENVDITGAYLFGERNFDKSQATFGLIVNPLGAGVYQNFSRNTLDITVYNATHKGSLDKGKHVLQWGNSIEQQTINDKINEWEYSDSAGYSLPYNTSSLQLNKVIKSKANLNATRFSGYVMDNIRLKDSSNDVLLQVGVRYNYNTLNQEFFISPRAGISFKPKNWKKDIIFKASAGSYNQPPFYREMRRYDGTVNTNLKSQKSWQASGGLDYNFKWSNRPARITTELYYKSMTDVVPYDVDNVRLRYFGENSAKAYAYGIETRIYADLVKDAESWFSIGFMKTKEKINDFHYYNYLNAAGDVINASTKDQVVKDSARVDVGYVRRPTDRTITLGLFLQDYLSTNKNFKVYLNTLYGSNMPYNILNSVKYRNALVIEPYIRVDLGLSALLLDPEKANRRSHSPFKNFQSIWLNLEVFNLIDRANTISYLLVKDFQNNVFTLPNRLTPRLLNLKLVAKW